jgi:hypothetical protein
MVTSDIAARRKYLESLGHTGRTDPELDWLNRALTDSCSTAELWRRKAEREAEGKPTGQIDAALRERGA